MSDDLHPCAVHVCDNTHGNGEGGVCEPCVSHAFDSTNKCPACDVVMCDGCGKRPAWAVIGGEGSPLWSCESCMNDLLSIPVQDRDFQAAVHPCEECAEVSE